MIATKDTGAEVPRRDHQKQAGDTPVLGLPVVPGSGGRRRAYTLGIDVDATAEIKLGDDVLWHDREAVVVEVYPATHDWTRTLCKIQFADDGPSVVVGRDELELIQLEDARYFVSLADAVLEDTAPLPSPVPRLSTEVPTLLLDEEQPGEPTEQLPRVGDVELDDDGQAALADPDDEEDAPSQTMPAQPAVPARPGAFAGLWQALGELLRIIGAFFAWPFSRDGGRELAGWIVDQVAEVVEAAASWESWHSRLVAKIVLTALSVTVFGGISVAWLVTR